MNAYPLEAYLFWGYLLLCLASLGWMARESFKEHKRLDDNIKKFTDFFNERNHE